MQMIQDSNLWDEVFAAVDSVAREKAQAKGFTQYRIDKETLEAFKKSIHCRITEDTRFQFTTSEVVHANELNDSFLVPEEQEVNEHHNSKVKVEYSANMKVDANVPTMGKAQLGQAVGIKAERESGVQKRYRQGPLSILPQSNATFSSGYGMGVRVYELEALASVRIKVNPAHPIAKRATIGGGAGAGAGAAAGGVAGTGVGSVIGTCIGIIAGPPGMVVGGVLGGTIGGVVGAGAGAGSIGGVGGAIGAARGVFKRHAIQITITAEDVFRKMNDFKKVGQKVFCHATGSRRWDRDERIVTPRKN